MNERTKFDKAFRDLLTITNGLPDVYNLLYQGAERRRLFARIETLIADLTSSAQMFDFSMGVETDDEGQSMVAQIEKMEAELKTLQQTVSQIESGGSVPDDLVTRLDALESTGATNNSRIGTLETSDASKQSRLLSLESSQTVVMNDVQLNDGRIATMEAFYEEDPDKGLIMKGDMFVDSMVVSGLFSTDTSSGGTSAGGRRTEINFTQDVPAGTNVELMPGAYASYTVTGVEPNIPNATALVNSPFIRLTLGPLEVDKETLTFVDTTTIRFGISIVAGTKIVVYS